MSAEDTSARLPVMQSVNAKIRKITGARVPKPKNSRHKYTRGKFVKVYHGYDCLENLLVVRTYMKKKYGVDLELLEILLYLVPKNLFTIEQYIEMPKQFTYSRIKLLIKQGHISLISKGKTYNQNIYRISTSSRHIVEKFYKYLSGEEPIPESARVNPMAKQAACKFDKLKMDLIKKINALPTSETKKGLYQ